MRGGRGLRSLELHSLSQMLRISPKAALAIEVASAIEVAEETEEEEGVEVRQGEDHEVDVEGEEEADQVQREGQRPWW